MIALVRNNPLAEENKAKIEYGSERELCPLHRNVFDERGQKKKVLVDHVFEVDKDHAVIRENIIKGLSEKFINPRIKIEADWQSKKVDEFVFVDGIKV